MKSKILAIILIIATLFTCMSFVSCTKEQTATVHVKILGKESGVNDDPLCDKDVTINGKLTIEESLKQACADVGLTYSIDEFDLVSIGNYISVAETTVAPEETEETQETTTEDPSIYNPADYFWKLIINGTEFSGAKKAEAAVNDGDSIEWVWTKFEELPTN